MKTYRKLVLRKRPEDTLEPDAVEVVRAKVPVPRDGEFLVRLDHLSMDVAMRGWMLDEHSYVDPIPLGDVPRACGAGHVIESRHPCFAQGDCVLGTFGARELAVSDGHGVVRVDTEKAPLVRWAGSLGLTTAMTAYLGLLKVGKPRRGQTVLVSGASGAVGSIVGQTAKLKGCRVVGIAGGAENCGSLVDALGFDAYVDYTVRDFESQLCAACPERVDVFFDNVGGNVLDGSLAWMKPHGRVVLCGMTADRKTGRPTRLTNIRHVLIDRLIVQGFILFDHASYFAEAAENLGKWYRSGRLKILREEEKRTGGLAKLVDHLNDLLAGRCTGKMVLKL